MLERLMVVGLIALLIAVVYAWCVQTTPRHGSLAILEHMCFGLMICYISALFLSPLGFEVPTTPIASIVVGYLGIPGTALMTFVSMFP